MLNSLEQRCLDLLEDLNVWLTKKVKPKQFIELIGRIRDLRYALINKKFGCVTGKHSAPCNCKGFTLIELMLVVTLISILAAIAVPNYSRLIRATQEARTKGNLHIMRVAIANYQTLNAAPPQRLEDILIGSDAMLSAIPLKYTPTYHPEGNTVTDGPMSAMTDARGDWFYDNSPTDAQYGDVLVNCVHTTLQGKAWSSQ